MLYKIHAVHLHEFFHFLLQMQDREINITENMFSTDEIQLDCKF